MKRHLPHVVLHVILAAGLIIALATGGGVALVDLTHQPKAPSIPARVTDSHLCDSRDYATGCALPPATVGEIARGVDPVAQGVDFGWSCPLSSAQSFGASYLSSDSSKNWSSSCVHAFLAAGKKIVMVWETSATRSLDGYAAGQSDARSADAQAHALGAPPGVHIDYAVDFDETPAQASAVASYFKGAASVNGQSRTGAYGGYYVVTRLCSAGITTASWQTYAWSGGRWAPASCAPLEQYLNSNVVDYDRAIAANYGQWPYATAKPPPPPKPKVTCWGKGSTPSKNGCPNIIKAATRDWQQFHAYYDAIPARTRQEHKIVGVIAALRSKRPAVYQAYKGPGKGWIDHQLAAERQLSEHYRNLHGELVGRYS